MKATIIIACLFLAGCADDRYVVMQGAAPQIGMAAALRDCKAHVLAQFNKEHASGAGLVGAVFGGAVGGAIGGLIDAESGAMPASDIDPAIERCMRERGYVGTSEN